jgi:hypothetical protein
MALPRRLGQSFCEKGSANPPASRRARHASASLWLGDLIHVERGHKAQPWASFCAPCFQKRPRRSCASQQHVGRQHDEDEDIAMAAVLDLPAIAAAAAMAVATSAGSALGTGLSLGLSFMTQGCRPAPTNSAGRHTTTLGQWGQGGRGRGVRG